MELPPNEAIVFVGGAKPINCLQSAYYQDQRFLEMTKEALIVTRVDKKFYYSEWESENVFFAEKHEENSGLIIELISKDLPEPFEEDLDAEPLETKNSMEDEVEVA